MIDLSVVSAAERTSPSATKLHLWQVLLVWVWVGVSLAAIFLEGQRLGLDRNVPNRLRYHAIPVAIAVLYHGHPHDYTAFKSLAMHFQPSGRPLDPLIEQAVDRQPTANDETYYWVADDRGMADYVIGAFSLFGPRTSSLYFFYFIVLGTSCALFLADAGRHPAMHVVLILVLGALYSCLSVIPFTQAYHPFMEPPSLFEPRVIELLSYIATVHLAFTAFTERPWTPLRIVAAIGQTVLLVACYHARSAIAWQVAFVSIASGASAVWRYVKSNSRLEVGHGALHAGALSSLVPCGLVVAGLLTLHVYQRSTYNPRYFSDMGSRTVWHNALMGLGANKRLAATYRLDISDAHVIDAVIRYMRQTHDTRLTPQWSTGALLDSLGNSGAINWFEYEAAARDLYWYIWRVDWPSALQCYLVDKPFEIARLGGRASRAASHTQQVARDIGLSQFSSGAIVIALPALVIILARGLLLWPIAIGCASMLAFSTLPALLAYPVVPTMMGAFAAVSSLAYVTAAGLLALLSPILKRIVFVSRAFVVAEDRFTQPKSSILKRIVFVSRAFVVAEDRFTQPESSTIGGRDDLVIGAGLAVATMAVCLYFAPRGFQAGFVDMGQDGYQLRQALDLSRGAVIFRDTFDQYGPLSGYLNTVGFLTLGRRLLAIKYFISGWYSLIAVALFMMARRWLSSALAAFSTLVWLALAPFYQHGVMISPHVYVLFLQTLATIVALRAPRLGPGAFGLVGVLAGLSWAMKQSLGTLFFLSILLYLALRWAVARDEWRPAAKAAAAVAIGFSGVIAVLLMLLWTQGALGDWYLQTVAFPREFYLHNYAAHYGWALGVRSYPALIANFIELQLAEPFYWVVIRLVVILMALLQVIRRHPVDDLLLMASITAFLWLAAFPSSSFMHQWWTASLTIAPFVFCVRALVMRRLSHDAAVAWATVAVVALIVSSGVSDRIRATGIRTRSLNQTMTEPQMFRGIRTDAPTKRAFEMLYTLMGDYRSAHPGTKLVSIDSSDGWWTGVAMSLPFLSFFDGNEHPHPVYWSLPVLSTTTYPQYEETLRRQFHEEHPLIIDSHLGRYSPVEVPGYSLLGAAQAEYGYWYLYAPRDVGSELPEASTFLASDGLTESGFTERAAEPALVQRLSSFPEGAWRGRIVPPFQSAEPVHLGGLYPLMLIDPALLQTTEPVNVYTWPQDLRLAKLDRAITPVTDEPVTRADIVRPLGTGAWEVEGQAVDAYSGLIQFREAPAERGARFVVRGSLQEGGFQVGFLKNGQWSNYVNVTREGLFEAVLEIQNPGQYSLIVANCVQSSWWQIMRRHWVGATFFLLLGDFFPNHFRISEAGWIRPEPAPATDFH
jgi:hypothetical protein